LFDFERLMLKARFCGHLVLHDLGGIQCETFFLDLGNATLVLPPPNSLSTSRLAQDSGRPEM
jgi:hypothetical protein